MSLKILQSPKNLVDYKWYRICNQYNLDINLEILKWNKSDNKMRSYSKIYNGQEIQLDTNNHNKLNISLDSQKDKIILYNTVYETRESLWWLFLHEIRHVLVKRDEVLISMLDEMDTQVDRLTHRLSYQEDSEDFDELYYYKPSEVDASIFATDITGFDFGINWFRQRLKKFKKRKK